MKKLLLIAFLLFPTPLLFSDESSETIIISAEEEDDVKSLSAGVVVISEEEIRETAPVTAADIFERIPGIQVEKSGGRLQQGSLTIRGSGSQRILILINGRPQGRMDGGSVNLNAIDPDRIKRIEIYKGANSALFGEGALGGAVNIILKEKSSPGIESLIDMGVGSYGTLSGGILLNTGFFPDRPLNLSLSSSFLKSANYFGYDEDGSVIQRDNTAGYQGDARFRGSWMINPENGLGLECSVSWNGSEKGAPGTLEFPTVDAVLKENTIQSSLNGFWLTNPVAGIEIFNSLNWRKSSYEDPSSLIDSSVQNHELLNYRGELQLKRKDDLRFLSFKTAAGGVYNYQQLTSTALINSSGDEGVGTVYQHQGSIYGRTEIGLFPFSPGGPGRIILYPALRGDFSHTEFPGDNSRRDDQAFSISTTIAIPFTPDKKAQLKGEMGTGYRLPSVSDLFWPQTAFAVGNPSLLPEKSINFNAALELNPWDFFNMEICYFYQIFENMIQWNPGPGGLWRPTNISSAHLTGMEIDGGFNFNFKRPGLTLVIGGGYSFLFARDMDTDSATYQNQLPRRPFEQARAGVNLKHRKGHFISVQGLYTGYRFTTAQNTEIIPASFILDASAQIVLAPEAKISISVRNLLNTPHIDIRDNPLPGREFVFTVSFTPSFSFEKGKKNGGEKTP